MFEHMNFANTSLISVPIFSHNSEEFLVPGFMIRAAKHHSLYHNVLLNAYLQFLGSYYKPYTNKQHMEIFLFSIIIVILHMTSLNRNEAQFQRKHIILKAAPQENHFLFVLLPKGPAGSKIFSS